MSVAQKFGFMIVISLMRNCLWWSPTKIFVLFDWPFRDHNVYFSPRRRSQQKRLYFVIHPYSVWKQNRFEIEHGRGSTNIKSVVLFAPLKLTWLTKHSPLLIMITSVIPLETLLYFSTMSSRPLFHLFLPLINCLQEHTRSSIVLSRDWKLTSWGIYLITLELTYQISSRLQRPLFTVFWRRLNLVPRGRDPFGWWTGIATSGQVQLRKSAIHGLPVTLRILRVKSDKSDWFWSQSIVFTQPFKTGMSLGLARGPDISSAWQKGPLGTRLEGGCDAVERVDQKNGPLDMTDIFKRALYFRFPQRKRRISSKGEFFARQSIVYHTHSPMRR